jgi:hypothetical protein
MDKVPMLKKLSCAVIRQNYPDLVDNMSQISKELVLSDFWERFSTHYQEEKIKQLLLDEVKELRLYLEARERKLLHNFSDLIKIEHTSEGGTGPFQKKHLLLKKPGIDIIIFICFILLYFFI